MIKVFVRISVLILCVLPCFCFSQTVTEKKLGLERGSDLTEEMQDFLDEVNRELVNWYGQLKDLYLQAEEFHQSGSTPHEFKTLLHEINGIKENIAILEESFREMAVRAGTESVEDYALWHQPATTIGQLVSDYGSTEYIYLMSPDIANAPLSVNSDLPIPRSSWRETLELILNHNGIGIKQLNPYLRELYLIGDDHSGIQLITKEREELNFLPDDGNVCFVLSPEPSDVRRIWFFLDKFVNSKNTTLQMIGRDLLIVGSAKEVLGLLKIYDFVSSNQGDRSYKLVTLKRVKAGEMAKVLSTMFNQFAETSPELAAASGNETLPENIAGSQAGNGLRVVTIGDLAQSLFLIGTREEISKAERIIHEVEGQVGDVRDKVIFTYKVRHSDAEELAKVLESIYALLVAEKVGFAQELDEKEVLIPEHSHFPTQPSVQPSKTNIAFFFDRYLLRSRRVYN